MKAPTETPRKDEPEAVPAVREDDGDWQEAADTPTDRESSEAGKDGIYPGYPVS